MAGVGGSGSLGFCVGILYYRHWQGIWLWINFIWACTCIGHESISWFLIQSLQLVYNYSAMPCETKDWELSQKGSIFQVGLDEVAQPGSPSVLAWLGPEEKPGFLWACADWTHLSLLLSLSSNRPLSSFWEKKKWKYEESLHHKSTPGELEQVFSCGVLCITNSGFWEPGHPSAQSHRFPWHKTDLQWHCQCGWAVNLGNMCTNAL